MAIVDELPIEPSEFDAVESIIKEDPKQEATQEQKPEIPEKYRGKSAEDIIRMHQEAEKLAGRHAHELGEVRKLADDLLKQQLAAKKEAEPEQEIDFFENPKEAIRQAVERNPRVLAAEQYALQAQREQAKQTLAQKHPDFGQIVQDEDFAKWVKSSPIRAQLYNMAEAYDVNAADELLTTYKELKAVKNASVTKEETDKRKQVMKAASVDASGTGESSKKVYRRADLIRLRINDPARYEALSDEIYAAYQEGRVK